MNQSTDRNTILDCFEITAQEKQFCVMLYRLNGNSRPVMQDKKILTFSTREDAQDYANQRMTANRCYYTPAKLVATNPAF